MQTLRVEMVTQRLGTLQSYLVHYQIAFEEDDVISFPVEGKLALS